MAVRLARNWWMLAVRGVCAILFGIIALAFTQEALEVLVLLYGAFALVDGVFALSAAVLGGAQGSRWWALLVHGLAGIVIGLITFFWPPLTALALAYIVAAWAIITGAFQVLVAIRLRKEVEGELWLVLSGVLSILFGIILIVAPWEGLLAIVWLIGIYAIVLGAILLALSLRLRSWHQTFRSTPAP